MGVICVLGLGLYRAYMDTTPVPENHLEKTNNMDTFDAHVEQAASNVVHR